MDVVIRGILIYAFLMILFRISGQRSLGQVTTFDFVLLLIIAETTQQALLGDDFSLANAIVLILTLFTVDILLSYLKTWLPGIARLVDGVPTVLISRGEPDVRALHRARIAIEDILEAARQQHGLERLDQIKFAVLEIGGNISIVPAEKS